MPFRPLSEVIDERYPPGSEERRRHDYTMLREGRILRVTNGTYRALRRVPLAGPVAAQFWYDILGGILHRFENRNDPEYSDPAGDIFYGALDGLAWRFFNDEYVPTWSDVKSGDSGKHRLVWRLRRRHAIEQAEAMADDFFAAREGTVDT